MDWTIGADIELMFERGGQLVSAVPVIGYGERELPNGVLFFDNVLAEFTVTPAKGRDEFVKNITENMEAVREFAQKRKLGVRIVSSAHYPVAELDSEEAARFGCSPDYDAYKLVVNEVACAADKTTLRTAGAHIHFGHAIFEDPYKVVDMVKLMDLLLGIPSLLKDQTPEAHERRTLYGKAGAHRPKAYPGGEYRSLSNWWVSNSEDISWIFEQTELCLKHTLDGKSVGDLGTSEEEVCRVINEADYEAAKKLVR